MIDVNLLEDGFYFVQWTKTKVISVIAVFNDKNEIVYMGDSNTDTIGKLIDQIKEEKVKLISKIPLPNVK